MPNVKFQISMDNRIKPGQTTRDEVLAALRAQGIPVQAADPVFDPISGELVRVDVNLPDTASQQAVDAIAANPGKSSVTVPIPDSLFLSQLNAATGLALASAILDWDDPTYSQRLFCVAASEPGQMRTPLGYLKGDGAANTYEDLNFNRYGLPYSVVEILNDKEDSTVNIPAGDLTITPFTDQGDPVVIANISPMIVTRPADSPGGGYYNKSYYIDVNGKAYLRHHREHEYIVPERTYIEAVEAGAV